MVSYILKERARAVRKKNRNKDARENDDEMEVETKAVLLKRQFRALSQLMVTNPTRKDAAEARIVMLLRVV